MFINTKTKSLLEHRFGPVALAIFLLCLISFFTRLVFLIQSAESVAWSLTNILSLFFLGFLFDISVAFYAVIPLVVYAWLLPDRFWRTKTNRFLLSVYFFIVIATLLFNAVSEWFFWQEFSVRYNFIAVDYLVYTTEVIGNIRQSYPVNTILTAILIISLLFLYLIKNDIRLSGSRQARFSSRTRVAIILLLMPAALYFLINEKWKNFSNNQYVNELAGNGVYDFGYAFWNNELDYDMFYKTIPLRRAERMVENEFSKGAGPVQSGRFTTHKVVASGPERKMNVILISVESLSAEFLSSYGSKQNITPNIDSLAAKGLLFTNLYASGTRTVRGLEALTLSIPPTPGQSIVKRPNNSQLFSLGSVFKSKGYVSRFFYGGYSYFDNMKSFFSQNGYIVTDRSALRDADIHYQNVWGVADEDLFSLSLRTLDQDYKSRKPFFAHIMTVSNHRPYTYPNGRIDIPSHTGREGAVKYTDYAIGKFIKEASLKPWFTNTLFVITADHCASSAGKVELPVNKYHIPMIFYAPHHIAPGKLTKLISQIDTGPSILGFLNFTYTSKFFGLDVFKMKSEQERAFISTYQSLGYLKKDKMVILEPNRRTETFVPDFSTGNSVPAKADNALITEAISNYELASYLYKHRLYSF